MDAFWIIMGASFLLAAVNFVIDRILGVRKETNALQKEVNAWNKEYLDAVKAKDDAKVKKLAENEKEMMSKMTKMMFLPFKSALFAIPLYILFHWLLTSNLQKDLTFTLPFPVPNFNIVTWDNIVGVTGLFILALIFFGLIINLLIPKLEELLSSKSGAK